MALHHSLRRSPLKLFELAEERKSVRTSDARGSAPDTSFTCDECRDAPICVLAFDPYNTNGDCLAEK